MAPTDGMEIFEARLASFETTIPGTKRRASGVKGTKAISWPHKAPTATDLAHAGFYYKPSATSPDNTVCFMCEARLDGWEEEDDPLVEHFKLSSNCPWALVMSVHLDDAEDPTTSKMIDARRETFARRWPHEGKRGWTCKVEKMVEAGWHFAPTPESDDFVTCAHCKLSLDGWEPKDNPFDEHYRRAPDCRFFTFAGTTAPKATRGKKGRQSKASRISTQSVISIASDHPSIPDFEDSIDQTTLSQDTVMSTVSKASTKGKKKTKGKGKGSKAKNVEPIVIEDSSVIEAPPAESQPAKEGQGRKRASEQISNDDYIRGERESTIRPERPTKRRDTRSRNSMAQEVNYPPLGLEASAAEAPTETNQPPRATRKRASSRARKVSTASTASKASLRADVPDDTAIEAELAAELEKPLSEDEEMTEAPTILAQSEPPKKGKNGKGAASTASVRKAAAKSTDEEQHQMADDIMQPTEDSQMEVNDEKAKKKPRLGKGKGKKKAGNTGLGERAPSPEMQAENNDQLEDQDSTIAEAQPKAIDMATTSDAGLEVDVPKPKKGGKKKAAGRPKIQKQEAGNASSGEQSIDSQEAIDAFLKAMPKPPSAKAQNSKTKEKGEKSQRSMPGAFDSTELSMAEHLSPPTTERVPDKADSPPRPVKEATPSPSPQSSDAENQPPSSRPSSRRPPLQPVSPSRMQAIQVPLVMTPKQSPSKLTRPIGGLTTSRPWVAVDVEMIFALSPGTMNKENVFMNVDGYLTSPEKKMTVEQWISHIAQETESRLREECERVVGVFEKEGSRAMTTLEGIECTE